MNKRILVLITLVCATIASVQSAGAATITVTNTNDSGAGSLRQALADANDGDTIDFSVTTPASITLTSGELLVDKSVTISGPGANQLAVDGNHSSRVFHIISCTPVAISGLTITNGADGLYVNGGEGILNDHATLTVSSCTLSGNSSLGGGIAIYNDYGVVTIDNSTISGNSAPYGASGAAIYTDGMLTVSNSVISGNPGTGIYNYATATLDNSTVSGSQYGIWNDGVWAHFTISNSTIIDNSSGGIYNEYGTMTINDSTISGNSGDFNNYPNGGGIRNESGMLTINGSTISGNSAIHGGGIYNINGTLTISNSTISGNSAILYETHGAAGAGIYNEAARLRISNSTISGNSAIGDQYFVAVGGGIANTVNDVFGDTTGSVMLDNSTLSGNSADYGGGIYSFFAGSYSATLTVSSCTLTGNSATYYGGGIYSFSFNHAHGLLAIGNSILKNDAVYFRNIYNEEGTVVSLGYNLSDDDGGGFLTAPGDQINTDPLLGPLQNNGGPTFTHELLTGSPAIDAGNPLFAPPPYYDQRGPDFYRAMNDRIDIGAFEVQSGPSPSSTPPPTPTPTPSPTPFPPCASPTPSATPTPQSSFPTAVNDFYGIDESATLSEPAPGVLVNDFGNGTLTATLITWPLHASSFQLNSDGSFTYTPVANYYGSDIFTYQAYDGTRYSDTAFVVITVRQVCSQGGFVTGGGKFFQDDRKCTFGFEAKMQDDEAQGNLEFQDHDMDIDLKAGTVDWVNVPNETDASFGGACSVNDMPDYTYFVQVHDRAEPGSNDDFSVQIYDPNGEEIYSSGNLLSGGNIQIHDTAEGGGPGPEWFYDCDGDGYTVSAGFSCTAPPCTTCCPTQDPGSGPDCDDNDPSATVSRLWFYDCDGDGYTVSQGFSCAPPPSNSCGPQTSPGLGPDCDDSDPFVTSYCY